MSAAMRKTIISWRRGSGLTDSREIIEKGGEKVRETGMYSLLEKLCDNKRIEYIKDAKYISFGIEPAAAYLIAKDSEIKNLRMIFTGKIAGNA